MQGSQADTALFATGKDTRLNNALSGIDKDLEDKRQNSTIISAYARILPVTTAAEKDTSNFIALRGRVLSKATRMQKPQLRWLLENQIVWSLIDSRRTMAQH
jgi:hypothetical protein